MNGDQQADLDDSVVDKATNIYKLQQVQICKLLISIWLKRANPLG